MSNGIQTEALLAVVQTCVRTAWEIVAEYGAPRLPQTPPYAVIFWEAVEISMTGYSASLANPSQSNTFTIHGRWPFPNDPSQRIDVLKIPLANALIAQLQSDPSPFADVGMRAFVTKVDPLDHALQEGAFDLTLTLNVITRADYANVG